MDNYIKLNSVNAGPFNRQQNIVEFEIPQGVWDLRDSYLQYNIPIQTNDPTAAPVPVNINWLKDDRTTVLYQKFPNVAIIRDASIVADRKGRIEDIRRVDQLRTNLRSFSKSLEVKESEDYLAMNHFGSLINQGYNVAGINGDFVKLGTTPSRMNDIVPVQVRLSDIFDFCNTPEYDTTRAGNTRIRTRLNLDRLAAAPVGLSANWDTGGTADIGLCNPNSAGVRADSTTVVLQQKCRDEDEWPYYVGQLVKIDAVGTSPGGGTAPTTPVSTTRIIEEINHNLDDPTADEFGQVEIIFESSWGDDLTGNQQYAPTLSVVAPTGGVSSPGQADTVVNVQYAEIVLRQVAQPQGLDEINFNTYSTEQTQGGGTSVYRNLFQLEPESTNVMITFPIDGLISQNNNLERYSLRLNNEDLIDDRDVVISHPIYKDRLNLGFQNLGTGLNDLLQNVGNTVANVLPTSRYLAPANDTQLIIQPVMVSTTEKLLQIQLNSSAADIDMITLFKELPRTFSY